MLPYSRWEVALNNAGWCVVDRDGDGRWYGWWPSKEQADMAATLLANEGFDLSEDVESQLNQMVSAEICIACQKEFMACQLHNDRCPADLS